MGDFIFKIRVSSAHERHVLAENSRKHLKKTQTSKTGHVAARSQKKLKLPFYCISVSE